MNRNNLYVSTVLGAFLVLGAFAQAQEETTAEPLELTRLREQFQTRVDQEMIPWRDKYKKELQKLEDRLIQERRLKEALAVKTERDYGGGLSSKPSDASSDAALKVPDSAAEARKFLTGTVWLVYAVEDKKREALIDVYHFVDPDNVLVYTSKKNFAWDVSSVSKMSIKFVPNEIVINFSFQKSIGDISYSGKNYTCILAGKPDLKSR